MSEDQPIVIDIGERTLSDDELTERAAAVEVEKDQRAEMANPRQESDPAEDAKEVAAQETRVTDSFFSDVDTGTPVKVWQDPMEAFLSSEGRELPKTIFKIRRANGFALDLELQALPTPRYNKMIQDFTTNKRDNVTGERVQVTKERDLKAQLIIETVQGINFGNAELMQAYKASDPHHLVEKMFLRGEIERIAGAIASLSGFGSDEELEEEAGNF